MASRKYRTHFTAEELRSLLDYEPDTGVFRWRVSRGARAKGQVTGAVGADGRLVIGINRKVYLAHRLAWLHLYGVWPTNDIDHIDGNRANNAIKNLRDATPSQNMGNSRLSSFNTVGLKGVTFDTEKLKYKAQIMKDRRHIWLGRFDTAEQAHAAYVAAARRLFGDFANPGN